MNIVICGGGSAGWLSAFIIANSQPYKHRITVIESSSVGIIGAGEASSGLLYDLLSGNLFPNDRIAERKPFSFDISDFMEKVNGTPKYALKHVNWAKDKGSYLAPIFGPETTKRSPDILFNYVISEYGLDKSYLSSHLGHAYERNKMPNEAGFGFQFDAFKVGEYMREYLLKNSNMIHIDSKIEDVKISSSGNIEHLVMSEGQIIEGDFFIDCTGFARVLAKKLDINWISYKDVLPVDRAMPFLMNYDINSKEKIEPITTAQALSSGWMWRTPLKHRKGCGYVYSSDFLTEDQAQDEVEKVLGTSIEPIKHIKFDSGRLESFWKKNCIVAGLASSFIEPLEATSIHATIMQIFTFCQEYLTEDASTTATESNINRYNKNTSEMYDYYKDFIVFHYQGGRDDSKFWRHIKEDKLTTPAVDEYIQRAKSRIPGTLHFTDYWGVDGLWKWTLAGLGFITPEQAKNELKMFNSYEYAKQYYNDFSQYQEYNLSAVEKPFEIFPIYPQDSRG